MTPQHVLAPLPLHARTPTPSRLPSHPPYSLPYLSVASPRPSTTRVDNIPYHDSSRDSSPPPLEDASDDTVVDNTQCQTPGPSVANNAGSTDEGPSAAALPSTSGNPSGSPQTSPESMKYWIQVNYDLLKELANLLTDVMENIENYSHLLDFALVCDIPCSRVERVKEDNPHDFKTMVAKVFLSGEADAC